MAAYTTIDDPSAYFKVQLYTGNGAANHAITFDDTDTDMQPDFVWIKNRDATDAHCWFDSVRGATKLLVPSYPNNAAEATDADTVDSFASDGFQVDADVKVNTNAEDYVAWCWKESATAGFDMVAYTGTGSAHTESHSLSAVPHLMIVKNRTDADPYRIYHRGINTDAETDHLEFDTGIFLDAATDWNDTAPTSSVFTVGTGDQTNENTDSFIAYLWTSIQGFSRFGHYLGNGNDNGVFVNTGFKPAWLLIKRSDGSDGWNMWDNKRSPYNEMILYLEPDYYWTEQTGSTDHQVDFLSNGFKLRESGNETNGAGLGPYIYMAFAEAPFVNSNGVPCNAR